MSEVAAGDELRSWLEAAAEWEREALSGDRTAPRFGGTAPRRPCGCTAESDRECGGWIVTTETGRVCLCACHCE